LSSPNAIQDVIKAYLQAHPWFSLPVPIGIYSEDEGDLPGKLEAALGPLGDATATPPTGGGLAIMIGCPYGNNNEHNSPRMRMDWTLDIECVEMPIICRSATGLNKTSYQAGRYIIAPHLGPFKGLHGWREAPGRPQLFGSSIPKLSADPTTGMLIQTIVFNFRETID
jgi:hypothetical protein